MKTDNTCLVFRPDGTCQGLYTEMVDLSMLGRLTVVRTMAIEYDNRVQAWRVHDRQGHCVYCSASRQVCLEWERRHLNWVLENS
jgi:hypothetical protein